MKHRVASRKKVMEILGIEDENASYISIAKKYAELDHVYADELNLDNNEIAIKLVIHAASDKRLFKP